jgi:TonB family protein
VLQQNAVKRVAPEYPEAAKAAGIAGVVEVRLLISEEGQVIEAEAINGPEPLHAPTLEAAKQWIFKPITLGKSPQRRKAF